MESKLSRITLLSVIFLSPFGLLRPGQAGTRYTETPVQQCVLSALDQLESRKEASFAGVQIPSTVELPRLSKEDALDDFNVGVQWFRSKWNERTIAKLRAIAVKASQTTKDSGLSADEAVQAQAQLKEIRSTLKFLRFLFDALDKDHEPPKAFDELATSVGKLREALQHHGREEWPAVGKRVLAAIKPHPLRKIEEGITDFKPAKRGNFNDWLAETIRWTEKTLSKGKGTALNWHQARKNTQALLAVYEVELQKIPRGSPESAKLESTVMFLLRQTELMGDEVGEHETAVVRDGLDYDKDIVPYPAGVVRSLEAFFDRLPSH